MRKEKTLERQEETFFPLHTLVEKNVSRIQDQVIENF